MSNPPTPYDLIEMVGGPFCGRKSRLPQGYNIVPVDHTNSEGREVGVYRYEWFMNRMALVWKPSKLFRKRPRV